MSVDKIVVGKIYVGKVVTVVRTRQVSGLYCRFGSSHDCAFEKDGFVKKIVFNAKNNRQFQKGDEIRVKCVSVPPQHPPELVLVRDYF
jgi:DNA-directed RNA polymerase subunit E'/Rpb7